MAFTNPQRSVTFPAGAHSGQARYVIGANTPTELAAFGIDVAILAYITDIVSGLEVGYFWIGTSNRFDGSGNNRVQAFGNVVYPIPGDPSSAGMVNVKTNFQQNMFQPYPQTIFKDQSVDFWVNVSLNGLAGFTQLEMSNNLGNRAMLLNSSGIFAGVPGGNATEGWHALAFANGWGNFGGAFVTGQYRFLVSPANCVQVLGVLLPSATKADGTVIATLPVGYRPARTNRIPAIAFPTGARSAAIDIDAAGNMTCNGANAATDFEINGIYSLDA